VFSARVLGDALGWPAGCRLAGSLQPRQVGSVCSAIEAVDPATGLETFALKSADGLVAIHEIFAQTMVDGLGVDRISLIPKLDTCPVGRREPGRDAPATGLGC